MRDLARHGLEVDVCTVSSRAFGARPLRSSHAGRSARPRCENNEPRSLETTGVQVFGWPPKGRSVLVELASHERAAVVQRLAESRWLPKRSSFDGVFVATTAVPCLSSSASHVIVDSATALRRVLIKYVDASVAYTTASISEVSTDDETMRTGNGPIFFASRRKK